MLKLPSELYGLKIPISPLLLPIGQYSYSAKTENLKVLRQCNFFLPKFLKFETCRDCKKKI